MPPNTTATVYVPTTDAASVTERAEGRRCSRHMSNCSAPRTAGRCIKFLRANTRSDRPCRSSHLLHWISVLVELACHYFRIGILCTQIAVDGRLSQERLHGKH